MLGVVKSLEHGAEFMTDYHVWLHAFLHSLSLLSTHCNPRCVINFFYSSPFVFNLSSIHLSQPEYLNIPSGITQKCYLTLLGKW